MFNQQAHLDNLTHVLLDGGIGVFPTDTVIGLGCLPSNESSIKRLIHIKRRSSNKSGFILLATSQRQLDKYADLNGLTPDLLALHSDKPTTYIVPARHTNAFLSSQENATQAVRLTSNEWLCSLCEKVGAIVSTSANLSGTPGATSLAQVQSLLGPQIDYYCNLEDTAGTGTPSRLYDIKNKITLRD